MKPIESIKPGFINPIVKKIYFYCGEYLDMTTFGAHNITSSGLKNVDIDVVKINDWIFKDFFFKFERARIGEIKVGFKVMAKEIKISITDLELCLYCNDDLFGSLIEDVKIFTESQINRVVEEINQNEKKGGVLHGFNIVLDIKNFRILFSPFASSENNEYLEIQIAAFNMIKPSWNPDKNNEKINNKTNSNEEIYPLEIEYKNFDINLLTHHGINTGEINTSVKKNRRIPILRIDQQIKIVFGIKFQSSDIDIIYDLNVQKLEFTFNGDIFRVIYSLYQRLAIYPYTSVIIGEIKKNIDMLKKDNRLSKVITELFKNIEKKMENFNGDKINTENLESKTLQKTDNQSEDLKAQKSYNVNFNSNIKVKKVFFVFYDDSIAEKDHVKALSPNIEGSFLDFFPYNNLQLLIENLTIENKPDDFKCHIYAIICKYFEINDQYKSDIKYMEQQNKELEPIEEEIESKYKSHTLFIITEHKNKLESKKSNEFIDFDDLMKVTESIPESKNGKYEHLHRKENIDETELYIFDSKNALEIKFQNDRFAFSFQYVNVEIINILYYSNKILEIINGNMKAYTGLYTPLENKNGEFSDKNCSIRDKFRDFISKDRIKQLKNIVEDIELTKRMLLDLPYSVEITFKALDILGIVKRDLKLLNVRNLRFSNSNIKEKNHIIFLSIKSLDILSYFRIENVKLASVKYDPENYLNDWGLRIDKVTNSKNYLHHSFLDVYKAIYQYYDKFNNICGVISTSICEWSKTTEKLNFIYNSHEIMGELYTILGQWLTKNLPKLVFFNLIELEFQNVHIDLVDNSKYSINLLNVLIQQFKNKNKGKKLNSEIVNLNMHPIKQLKALTLDCSILSSSINIQEGVDSITFDSIKLKLFEFISKNEPEFMFEIAFNSCMYLRETQNKILKFHTVNSKLNQTKERLHFVTEYIFEVLLKQVLPLKNKTYDYSDKLPDNDFTLTINKFDFTVYDPIINIELSMDEFKFDSSWNLDLDLLTVSHILLGKEKIREKMINIKGLSVKERKDISIRMISGGLHINYIKMISDVWTSTKEACLVALKKTEILYGLWLKADTNDLLISEITVNENSYDVEEDSPRFSSWDIFKYFDEIINNKTIERPEDYNKRIKQFSKFCQLPIIISNTITIEVIKFVFVDDIYGHRYYIDTGIISLISSKYFNTYIIERFEIYIEKSAKKTLIAFNHKNDFALKLFTQYDEHKKLGFYLKIDDLDLNGDSKLWDILDNRLKIVLKEFSSADPLSKESSQTKYTFLSAAILASINLHINIFSEKIILEIDTVKSNEIVNAEITLNNFNNLFYKKTIASLKETAKYISISNSLKLAGFILWRLFVFVFFKRNFMKVNKSIYRYFRSKNSN